MVPASVQRMAMDGVGYRMIKGAGQVKAAINVVFRRGETAAVVRKLLPSDAVQGVCMKAAWVLPVAVVNSQRDGQKQTAASFR